MIITTKGSWTKSTRSLLLVVGCIFGFISAAHATSGSANGQVGGLEIVGSGGGAPSNFAFRVFLVGQPVICNGQVWAYVNTDDANYNAIVANVLSARALGIAVTLNWNQDSLGYCQLAYMSW
jgi:hypothetical protein